MRALSYKLYDNQSSDQEQPVTPTKSRYAAYVKDASTDTANVKDAEYKACSSQGRMKQTFLAESFFQKMKHCFGIIIQLVRNQQENYSKDI